VKRKSVASCPKCGSLELTLTEQIACHAEWSQDANGKIDREGYNGEGSYFRVDGRCGKCNHGWRVPGVTQITDFPNHHSHSAPRGAGRGEK